MVPPTVAEPLLVLGAIAAALLTVWKVIVPSMRAIRATSRRAGRALDVVLGTPAVPDPDRPGEFIRPAVPDMGVRMTAVEEAMVSIVTRATEKAQAAAEGSAESAEQARRASDHAARDARLALAAVSKLRAAAAVWHADELDVLTALEQRVSDAHPDPKSDNSEEE